MVKNLTRKDRIERAIILIGIPILILLWMNLKGRKDVFNPAQLPPKGLANLSINLSSTSEVKKRYTPPSDWGRDPFYPQVTFNETAGGLSGDFVLNGIVWDKEAPYAIINGEIVKKGDIINNAR